jgi:hypothetical protein
VKFQVLLIQPSLAEKVVDVHHSRLHPGWARYGPQSIQIFWNDMTIPGVLTETWLPF